MIVSSFSFGVSSDRLSSLSVAVTSILVHIDLHADVILCLRKFGQKTYCLNLESDPYFFVFSSNSSIYLSKSDMNNLSWMTRYFSNSVSA